MEKQLLYTLIGLIVSSVLAGFLSTRQSKKVLIRDAISGGALGVLLTTTVLVQIELSMLNGLTDKIIHPNLLVALDKKLAAEPGGTPMRSAIEERKLQIEEMLAKTLQGKLDLADETEVIKEWRRFFEQSATSVIAFNYVTPTYWIGGSAFSTFQRDVQQAARKKGIPIRRLFIYDSASKNEVADLKRLASQLTGIGVEVRYFKHDSLIASKDFLKYSPMLRGSIDFVLYDLNALLLTQYNPVTREVEAGLLTSDRSQIDAAKELFEKIWPLAEQSL